MTKPAPAWVVPAMRAGYAGRALVYTVVGGLALAAAIWGGSTQGTTNALTDLRSVGWGVALLWLIGVGLLGYMVWRLICAALDLDDHGSDGKGIIARTGQVVTGLIHGALGVSAIRLAAGGGDSGGSRAESLTAMVMQMPYGPYLVGFVAVCVVGAGGHYLHKGWTGKYRRHIRSNETTMKLDPVLKFGFIAHGVVIAIVGVLILSAALTADPNEAGGVGAALGEIRDLTFGRVLLVVISTGLLAFALENAIEAAYRFVPRRSGEDVSSLARRFKHRAQAAAG